MSKSARGQNKSDIFRWKKNAAGTGIEFYDKLTDVIVTPGPPTPANAALRLDKIGTTKPTPQADGTVQHEYTQYDCGENVYAFIDKTRPANSTNALPDVSYEDGALDKSSTEGDGLLLIDYGQFDDLKNPTKVFVYAVIMQLDPTSGAYERVPNDWIKPTMKLNGITTDVDFVIPKELFDPAIVTVAANITILAGDNYVRQYITKA